MMMKHALWKGETCFSQYVAAAVPAAAPARLMPGGSADCPSATSPSVPPGPGLQLGGSDGRDRAVVHHGALSAQSHGVTPSVLQKHVSF